MVSARIAQNKRRVASYIGAGIVPPQGGGVQPSPGYFFLQGKNADGSYSTLTGLNADASRSNLQGKAA